MYGWRARIGLIVPSSNTTAEMEFHKMSPRGISVHVARVFNPEEVVTAEEKKAAIFEMNKQIAEASKRIASVKPDVVVYACTTGSFLGGPGYDRELIRIIQDEVKAPAVTATTALIEALRTLGVSKIDLVTPYLSDITAQEREVFENADLHVCTIRNFVELAKNLPKGRIVPERVYAEAKAITSSCSEALVLSCTNMRTIEIIEVLERDIRKPVISSNTASMWCALKSIGLDTSAMSQFGMLFQKS